MLNKHILNVFIWFFIFPICFFFKLAVSKELPNESIYNLKSILYEYNGNSTDISCLQGKVQIFSMIYTNCKTVCPIIISNMKSLEKIIPEDIAKNVGFVLISLDPERDSISSLNKFFDDKKFTKDKWRLFKTSKEETLKIALTAGIKYKKEKNNEYTHSNLIIVLDRDGVIKFHHQGLDKNYENLIKIIKKLV